MFQREIPRPAIPRNLGPGWETQSFLTKNQLPIGEATKLCQKITHDTNPKRHKYTTCRTDFIPRIMIDPSGYDNETLSCVIFTQPRDIFP